MPQIVAEDSGGARQELEGALAGRRLGVRERPRLSVVVLGDERDEITTDTRPFLERELQKPCQPVPVSNDLGRAKQVGGTEAAGGRIGVTDRRIVDAHEQGLQIVSLRLPGALAYWTARPAAVEICQAPCRARSGLAEPGGYSACSRAEVDTTNLLDEPAQQILVEDGGARPRPRLLEQHPRVPVAEPPGGAQCAPRVDIGDLLVKKRSQLFSTVPGQAVAHRAARMRTGLQEAQLSQGWPRIETFPRWQGRPRVSLGAVVGLLALSIGLLLAGDAPAATVTAEVRRYTDRALEVLGDPSLSPAQRDSSLRAIARQLFDPEEAARRALGKHWQTRSTKEQAEFTELFAQLLERTYLTRVGAYRDARLAYVGESVDGSFAVVRAKVLLPEQIEVPVEARLHRRGDRWYAYDIVVEGISLINNYRAQFDKIIRTSSYEELVRRLRERLASGPGGLR